MKCSKCYGEIIDGVCSCCKRKLKDCGGAKLSLGDDCAYIERACIEENREYRRYTRFAGKERKSKNYTFASTLGHIMLDDITIVSNATDAVLGMSMQPGARIHTERSSDGLISYSTDISEETAHVIIASKKKIRMHDKTGLCTVQFRGEQINLINTDFEGIEKIIKIFVNHVPAPSVANSIVWSKLKVGIKMFSEIEDLNIEFASFTGENLEYANSVVNITDHFTSGGYFQDKRHEKYSIDLRSFSPRGKSVALSRLVHVQVQTNLGAEQTESYCEVRSINLSSLDIRNIYCRSIASGLDEYDRYRDKTEHRNLRKASGEYFNTVIEAPCIISEAALPYELDLSANSIEDPVVIEHLVMFLTTSWDIILLRSKLMDIIDTRRTCAEIRDKLLKTLTSKKFIVAWLEAYRKAIKAVRQFQPDVVLIMKYRGKVTNIASDEFIAYLRNSEGTQI